MQPPTSLALVALASLSMACSGGSDDSTDGAASADSSPTSDDVRSNDAIDHDAFDHDALDGLDAVARDGDVAVEADAAETDGPSSSDATPPPSLAESPFGLNQGTCDPVLAKSGFLKGFWDKQGDATALAAYIAKSDTPCGQTETPLVVANWDHQTAAAITKGLEPFFAAHADIPLWELGREENLGNGDGCCNATQLALLATKLKAARAARLAAPYPAGKSGAGIELAYQVVGVAAGPSSDYAAVLDSAAAADIDVLAPHPYPWPDFPTPETWHDAFIGQILGPSGLIATSKTANKKMTVMYTEAGAPVCDTNPNGCAMDGGKIRGQGQEENAEYLVKLHVMAWNAGVRRVYWYSFRDPSVSGADPVCGPGDASMGEACFAMANTSGNRLSYSAYRTLVACMEGKTNRPTFRAPMAGVRVYEFSGKGGSCLVTWAYDATTERIAPTKPILAGVSLASLTGHAITSVLSTTGSPIAHAGGSITLSPAPVFVLTSP